MTNFTIPKDEIENKEEKQNPNLTGRKISKDTLYT